MDLETAASLDEGAPIKGEGKVKDETALTDGEPVPVGHDVLLNSAAKTGLEEALVEGWKSFSDNSWSRN